MVKIPSWAKVLIYLTCWPAAVLPQDKALPLHVFEDNGTTINLLPGQCSDPFALAAILPEWRAKFRAIESNWHMKDGSQHDFAGCWIEEKTDKGEDAFYLLFNDGDQFLVLKSAFDKRQGQTGI